MNLILIWSSFILLMSFSEELDQYYFYLFSISMFYSTYIYNKIRPIRMPMRLIIIFFNIPIIILWYMAFVYNDFLSITPISYETFMSLFFAYIYVMLNFFLEYYKLFFYRWL